MNKTFNINLGGYPFAIDEDAYEYIQNYLGTIRKHFSTSDGCEEIIYDIEVRMAELFQEHLKGRAIISMKEIDEVIMIMGKPEDFGAEPMDDHFKSSIKGKMATSNLGTGKRLFRDPDDKKVAGVCAGIAAYFGIEDPLWVRLIFVLLLFTGTGVITYIVLWALVPEASNSGDKLAMRGEPATIENIAKLVEEELTGLGDKINEWSKDLGSKKKSDDITNGFSAKSVLSTGVNIFGSVVGGFIPTLRKVFKPLVVVAAIVLLSLLGISWAASFIGLTLASPLMFAMGPASSLIGYMGIASSFFTVGLPLLGIMLYIARLAFGYKVHKNVKTGFWIVWFLSIFVTSFAAVSTIKEYTSHFENKEVYNYNINAKDIKIVMPEENVDHSFGIHLGEFITEIDDNWAFRDVSFSIEKSKDNQVHIEKIVSSRGKNTDIAQKNAQIANNEIIVNDNEIRISKYITFPKSAKYRNQSIDYIIYIPEGKTVTFDENSKERMRESSIFTWDQIYQNSENLQWTMKANGLFSEIWDDTHHHIKNINTNNYSKIIIQKGFNVNITKSETSSITFEGNKQIIERIKYKNLDGTLDITPDSNDDPEGITINIKIPTLELIHFDGIKAANIEGFSQENLKLVSIGTYYGHNNTEINFWGNIKNMEILMDGAQSLNMTGSGDLLNLFIENGAQIIADKYIVKQAIWNRGSVNGSSLHVIDKFSAKEPEMMQIKLIGSPKIVKI